MGVKSLRITVLAEDYAGYEVKKLYAQHGLSILLEISLGSIVKRVLFDTGQDGSAVIHNAEVLGIDLGDLDAIVLSHSHYDHSGGLLEILKIVRKKPVPLIAHPDIAKPCIYLGPEGLVDVGLPYALHQAEELGAKPLLITHHLEIFPGVVFLGEVPRHRRDLVSEIPNLYTIESGKLVTHRMLDDTGLVIDVENYGPVLTTGCSHSGVVNMVIHARNVLGKPVRAVVGGLHLVDADEERINEVIEALKNEGVEEVYAGHCTGLRAEYALLKSFGNGFRRIHTGFSKTFP